MFHATSNLQNLLVVGSGRMGSMIADILRQRGHQVGAIVGSAGDATGRSLADVLASGSWEAAWDFTLPGAAPLVVEKLIRAGIPTITGTTGWDIRPVVDLANRQQISFMHAPNFSLGVAVMRRIVASAARLLSPFDGYQSAVFERHHGGKQDRPSGTARMLAEALGEPHDVEIACVRQGGVPGEHTVFFDGAAESIEIVHRARSRQIFAHGAVVAGEWLVRECPNCSVTLEDFLERTWSWMPSGMECSQRL